MAPSPASPQSFALGALCGAAVALLAVWLWPAAPAGGADAAPAPRARPETATGAGLGAERSVATTPGGVLGSTRAPVVAASGPMPPVATLAPGPRAEQAGAPPVSALTGLSAEHARMLAPQAREGRPLSLQEWHARFTTERKDDTWALAMEQTLRLFLQQQITANEFEILAVDCRSTLCEILAFGNLPTSGERWNQLTAELGRQPWANEFQGNHSSSSGQNGRTTIVTLLQRAGR
jgi:hypothetical protein